jgi:caa(3)-type oxidase subunit IV
MSTTAPAAHGSADHGAHEEHIHPPKHYIKLWAILCGLLIVSFLGPMIGIQVVTLLTAFGIAIVKAYIVCAYFMHLNIEKKYAALLELTVLALISLFYFAVAPDVMKHQGTNWTNVAAEAQIKWRLENEDEHGHPKTHGAEGHGGAAEHGATTPEHEKAAEHEAPKH